VTDDFVLDELSHASHKNILAVATGEKDNEE